MNLNPDASALTGFDALDVALELIRRLRPIIEKIRRHDRKEAEQLQSAAQSMARNLAEGRRRLGRDRVHQWSVAAGSTDEARTSVLMAYAAGWIDDADLESVWSLFDRELAMTWNMTH